MTPSLPVLYSFRRCPYAMRARLALAASGQTCELREVVLKNKPAELLQASPKATVPVLVLPEGGRSWNKAWTSCAGRLGAMTRRAGTKAIQRQGRR